ncbi:MAG: 3-methyl-2-oxobutanoate hydroxymethyltransferase [Candidatus Hydrogenedentes bacterium]|jgi:3-methyl-2-oxobutanoate hydroxymethyltransferase|nr:3-methyl-2-oxobutanoate hydroxymethyltransferase [Candidatus Hydrogenedentota bacterium]
MSITTATFRERKERGEKITILTAYDCPTAALMDEAGVDAVLVGDSMGNVVMGMENTLGVTMDMMLHHVKMVRAGVKHAMLIADMPFLSYQVSVEDAVRNAGRLVAEGGAQAVKLEGPARMFGNVIHGIIRTGIPVMGHLGLTPQSVHQIGGYKVQGRGEEQARRLRTEAMELQAAGCFAIVLECIPAEVAAEISQSLAIPTIGIGAGPDCDGQVLVSHDMLGWGKTRFTKTFADARTVMRSAFGAYVREVKDGTFPGKEQCYE